MYSYITRFSINVEVLLLIFGYINEWGIKEYEKITLRVRYMNEYGNKQLKTQRVYFIFCPPTITVYLWS